MTPEQENLECGLISNILHWAQELDERTSDEREDDLHVRNDLAIKIRNETTTLLKLYRKVEDV